MKTLKRLKLFFKYKWEESWGPEVVGSITILSISFYMGITVYIGEYNLKIAIFMLLLLIGLLSIVVLIALFYPIIHWLYLNWQKVKREIP